MLLVETPAYKALETYRSTTLHRVYQFGGVTLFLLIFLVFYGFFHTPRVFAYNGVDMWYWLVMQVPFGGVMLLSGILTWTWGRYVYWDLAGIKDPKERAEDRAKKKKDKTFTPKPKGRFELNGYYVGFLVIEGFLYGSLLYALLPGFLGELLTISDDPWVIYTQFDRLGSIYELHSNPGQDIALAFGAGIYEEIIFRGLLFGLIFFLAKKYGKKHPFLKQYDLEQEQIKPFPFKVPKYKLRSTPYASLMVLTTFIYALSHVLLPFGDNVYLYGFLFRMFFGGCMYVIFVKRGLAMAMWSHVVYGLLYFSLS